MDTLGWLLVESGEDRAHGLKLLREAARKAPQNNAILEHLAKAEKA